MTTETTISSVFYGFHRADFETWLGDGEDETIDLAASFDAYVARLETALATAFPGAEIEIDWDTSTTGALPHGLKPRIDGLADDPDVATIWDVVGRVDADLDAWIVTR